MNVKSSRVGSKANIEMIKNLKKQLITLSSTVVSDDKTQVNTDQEDLEHHDSSSD